jgi:hypothetical protein
VICGHCLALSLFFPASSLLFSQKYKQNYRAFEIQKLPESKKELTTEIKQISIVLRVKLAGLAFVEFFVSTSLGYKAYKIVEKKT